MADRATTKIITLARQPCFSRSTAFFCDCKIFFLVLTKYIAKLASGYNHCNDKRCNLVLLKVKKTKAMNFFSRKTTWSNAEFIPLKLCIASFYIVAGAYFYSFVQRYYWLFIAVFAVCVIWTVYLWLVKMRKENKKNLL